MKKKFLRGEITTAFTVSILLGLTLFSLASQYLLMRRQTTKTKASESPYCFQENNEKKYLFFERNTGKLICSQDEIKKGNSSNPIDAWLVGNTPCNANNCPNNNNTWCYGNPPTNYCLTRDTSCDNGSCFGGSSGSSGSGSGSGSGGGAGGGSSGSTSGSGVSNGCFSLRAEFEAKDENDKKAFYAWVTFESNRGGDVKLEEAGQHVAGWNSFAGGSFTYDPNWSQHWRPGSWIAVGTLTKGQSYTVYYRGILSGCNPQDVSLSCNLTHKNNGSASVSGNGCFCRNCGGGSTPPSSPTATPTPKPNPPNPNNSPTPTPTPTPTPVDECEKAGGECFKSIHECKALSRSVITSQKEVNYCKSQHGNSAVCCQIQEPQLPGGKRPPGSGKETLPKICQIKQIKWLDEDSNKLVNIDINLIKENENDLFIYIGGNENCANVKIETINFLKDNKSLNSQLKNFLFLKNNCLQNDNYCIKESVKNIITEGGSYQFQFSFNNQTKTSPILEVTGSIPPNPPTNTLTPTITPILASEPKCDVNDPNYCIDSEAEHNQETNFPWCQLPNGKWVKMVQVSEFTENCSAQIISGYTKVIIPGLSGNRKVLRVKKRGSGEDKNNCIKKIQMNDNNFCIDEPGPEDQCELYCELRPTYSIKIIFKNSFFQKFFPALRYEEGTYFAFLSSSNFFGKDLTRVQAIPFSEKYKDDGYIHQITDIDPQYIISFFKQNISGYLYDLFNTKIVVKRKTSGQEELITIHLFRVRLNIDDLSIIVN